jgi:hypothetical protein
MTIMNIVPRHVARLAAIGAFALGCSQLASATDRTSGATIRLAMGPMSAAQKNQGASGKPDEVAMEPRHHAKHHRAKHKHAHHAM